jgi:hypothetical protein
VVVSLSGRSVGATSARTTAPMPLTARATARMAAIWAVDSETVRLMATRYDGDG